MKNCNNCAGTGLIVHPTGLGVLDCDECAGRGYFSGQLPTINPLQATPTQEAKPVNKMLTIVELERINRLLEDHARIMNDLRGLDEAMIAAAANPDSKKRISLSIIGVELRDKSLTHFGIAIRAILVQQEVKIRRKLAKLNFHLDAPDPKDMPYYEDHSLVELECLASMMGKPFDEE